jgi:hypothetical protein
MVKRARRTVLVLDVYDEAERDAMAALKQRHLGDSKFRQKYDGLQHLYFERDWFKGEAQALGLAAQVFDQPAWLCDVSQYRFSVIMRKPKHRS